MNIEEKEKRMRDSEYTEDTIDLLELSKAILGHWVFIVLSMIVLGCAMGFYNLYIEKPTYSAEAQIYISNTDSIISLQELQLSAALTEDYSNILTSRNVLKKVISDLGLEMDYKQLKSLISITNPSETHILNITVTTEDPDLSVTIANSLILFGVDRILRIVGQETPSVIDYAENDAVTVNKTRLATHVGLGALIGMALVCLVVIVRFLLDNTIKDEDDVRRITHYDVLAEIPEYDEDVSDQEVKKNGSSSHRNADQAA